MSEIKWRKSLFLRKVKPAMEVAGFFILSEIKLSSEHTLFKVDQSKKNIISLFLFKGPNKLGRFSYLSSRYNFKF